MFRKSFFQFVSVAVLVMGATLSAVAQSSPVTGVVEMDKDGKREPVAGAVVEPYRMDIRQGAPAAKTNSRGQFSFAGLQLGWTYLLVVSAPGAAPTYLANVRAGQEKLVITMLPGDGSRMTEEEAKKMVAAASKNPGGQTPVVTEDMKKAQAENETKRKEVEEKNKKAEAANAITARAIKEGKEAMDAKNYAVAAAKYLEGYEADPDFVGSAPVFLLNRGIALVALAIELHNANIKAEPSVRLEVAEVVKKHLGDAVEGYQRALTVQKNAPAADIGDKAVFDATRVQLYRASADVFRRSVETERVDDRLLEAAKVLVPEYLQSETDAARKLQIGLTMADMYRIREDRENAIAGYKKVLELAPDNADALAYLGIVLVDLGWLKGNDKELSQEGANYLQKFVAVAPDTHRLKTGAVEYLAILKAQSIVPVKPAAAPRKRP